MQRNHEPEVSNGCSLSFVFLLPTTYNMYRMGIRLWLVRDVPTFQGMKLTISILAGTIKTWGDVQWKSTKVSAHQGYLSLYRLQHI